MAVQWAAEEQLSGWIAGNLLKNNAGFVPKMIMRDEDAVPSGAERTEDTTENVYPKYSKEMFCG